MTQRFPQLTQRIREKAPLILNITNAVTMDFIANGLLSLGASPMMSQALEELVDLIAIADAVVINIGTLHPDFIHLCQHAAQLANQNNKPIIFDPVGCGASEFRTNFCLDFLSQHQLAIVRGNANEIMALTTAYQNTTGVDASLATQEVAEVANKFAKKHGLCVVMSGAIDVVTDGRTLSLCERGTAWMAKVTGSGCLLSAVVAAFDSVSTHRTQAALAAVNFYGECGEIAAVKAQGPGSFKVHFLDALALPIEE